MKRSSLVMILLALVGVVAGAWFLFWPRLSLPADPLAVVPADAYGVLRVRVDRVLASTAYKRLIVERGQARGIERVEVLCGFNPLERISELLVFARAAPEGGLPRFAFAARGDLHHEELIDCVKKFTGGDASALKLDEIEGIPVVESKKGTSRAAFIGRDGVLGGDAEAVRAAIHTLLGKAPSMAEEPLLSGLFRQINQGSDIALVTRVPEEARAALQLLGPLAAPGLQQLEGLQAASVNLSEHAGRLAGGALLVTRSPAHAEAIVGLAKGTVARLLAIPGIGLTPASSVLRSVQMEAEGDRATFAGTIRVSTIEALLELVPAMQRLVEAFDPKPPAPVTSAPDAGANVADTALDEADASTKRPRRQPRRTRGESTRDDGDNEREPDAQ